MKRNSTLAIATIVVIGSALLIGARHRGPSAAQMTRYKLATVSRGPVRKTVSSTGTLQPWTTVDIKSKAGGRVVQMLVDVGTQVKKGQIIARIDPSDTLLSVDQARSDIASANAKRNQSIETYALQVAETKIGIANARASLLAAEKGRSAAAARLATARRQAKAQPAITDAAVAQAQASYDQAVKQRIQVDVTNQQNKAAAQSAYDQAVANARNAKANLARQKSLLAKGFVSQQAVDNAQASNDVAQAQVDSAHIKLQTIDAEQRSDVETADARVAQARAALRSAKANAIDVSTRLDSVREAEAAYSQADAQVAQAREALRQAIANQRNDTVRRLDIAAAAASQTRSQAALKNATDTLAQTTVRAPSAGVILQKYVDEGTIITSGLSMNTSGSSIVQLGDTTRMYVDVTVDETDIANIETGQPVDVSMDAYPDMTFEGKVARIDPRAVVESNVTQIHVRVEVDNSSPTFRLLKPGMNATCDFVVGEKASVITVPTTAVQTDDQGTFVQMANGGTVAPAEDGAAVDASTKIGVHVTRRSVQAGIQGEETTEILSGLREGEVIVAQTIQPDTSTTTQKTTSAIKSGMPGGGGTPPPPPGH